MHITPTTLNAHNTHHTQCIPLLLVFLQFAFQSHNRLDSFVSRFQLLLHDIPVFQENGIVLAQFLHPGAVEIKVIQLLLESLDLGLKSLTSICLKQEDMEKLHLLHFQLVYVYVCTYVCVYAYMYVCM